MARSVLGVEIIKRVLALFTPLVYRHVNSKLSACDASKFTCVLD